MNRTPREQAAVPRRLPPRHRWSFEELEDRALLSAGPGADLGNAPTLGGPSDTVTGTVAPGGPLIYKVDSGSGGLLTARVHAAGLDARLSLLDANGQVLVQSDGQSPGNADPRIDNADPRIDQHLPSGTFYLEVESLGGSGNSSLTTTLTATTDPFATIPPVSPNFMPLAVGDFNHDGILDYVTVDGAHLGTGDGTFRAPRAGAALIPGGTPSAIVAGDFTGDGHLVLAVADSLNNDVAILTGDGQGNFSITQTIAVGLQPVAITAVDSGAGHLDLAVAGTNSDTGQGDVAILTGDGQGNFSNTQTITVGQAPSAIVAGDFTGDGHLDLAVADFGSSDITILRGDGQGNFSITQRIAVGQNPVAIAAGTFTGDGHLDLAVAGEGTTPSSSDVTILTGDGRGNFTPEASIPFQQVPLAVAVGDFTGDGHLDLAVAEYGSAAGSGDVRILRGDGQGHFNASSTVAVGPQPVAIAAGDFTGDGRADLAFTNAYTRDVTVLLNESQGSFLTVPPRDSTPLAVGDLNNDGHLDFVTADGVHLGAGDGTFETPTTAVSFTPSGDAPSAIAVGDFTGDGHLDLAVADAGSNVVTILVGNGDGTFADAGTISVGEHPDALVAGDFTGDGHLDLAVVDQGSPSGLGNVTILRGDGQGHFAVAGSIAVGRGPVAIAAGDFTGDGHLDLAVADYTSNDVTILEGDGQGHFAVTGSIAVGRGPVAIAAGDFTGDGHLDLAVADVGSIPGTGGITILRGDGRGGFRDATPSAIETGSTPRSLLAGDFNGDGRDDLAVADAFSNSLTILLSQVDGTFSAEKPIAFGQAPAAIAAGDFNGDGRADLVVADEGASDVTTVLGLGDGTFRGASTETIGLMPYDIATGDFTGGGIDLAVANIGSNDVTILRGNGDGTFQNVDSIPVGQAPDAIVAGDFNGDGRADLAVANFGSNDVTILLGLGDGTFHNAGSIPVGQYPIAIVAGDFTGDGKTDLAVAYSGSNNVTILLGNGNGTFRDAGSFSVGQSPIGIVAGDFTGDGRTELAVADNGSHDVTILSVSTDGTVQVAPPIPVGQAPLGIVAGDFYGDHRTELAVTDGLSSDITILTNNGRGSLVVAATLKLPASPGGVVAGDFDGNGRTELAVNTSNTNDVSILRVNVDGTFQDVTHLPPVGLGSLTALRTADLTGDGRDDLVLGLSNPSDVAVQLSLGGGRFSDPATVASAPRDVPLVADLNGDGTPDAVVVDASGRILVRQGRPDQPGSFEPPITANPGNPSRDVAVVSTGQGILLASVDASDPAVSLFASRDGGFVPVLPSLPTGMQPVQVLSGDLDGNGRDDLVVRNAGDGTLSLYLGDGQGGFLPRIDLPAPGASDVSLADLDHSGRLDILLADETSGDVRILHNLGGGAFTPPTIWRAGSGPYGLGDLPGVSGIASQEATAGVVAGTFRPGGPQDLVAINPGSNTFSVLKALGDGRYANPEPSSTKSPGQMAVVADFTGNGLDDLAVLDGSNVEIFLNDGRGGFSGPMLVGAGDNPTGLAVADVNGDGIPDLLIGNTAGDLLVLLGNGDGTFRTPYSADQSVALAVGTVGSNGQPMFVFSDQGRDQVVVKQGPSQPGGTVVGDHATGLRQPGAVVLADLTGDGIPDLIVANSGGNDVLVYPGLSDGTLDVKGVRAFFTGTDPVGITVADLTGDGRLDLVVANEGSNDVSILLNEPTPGGGFTLVPGPRLKAGYGPMATTVADVNGDGIPDILVSDSQSNDVRVLYGVGGGFFNDVTPLIIPVGMAPGPLFVANFTGRPGQLDLVTLNAHSNDLSLVTDINGGNHVAQSISAAGVAPIAAVIVGPGDFGTGAKRLLLAGLDDDSLPLFLGGPDGLKYAATYEEPGLPHPTALAEDEAGNIFGVSEGSESAILVNLGLGIAGGGRLGGGGGDFGFPGPQTGSDEQQVAILTPLNDSTPALVETLLSVLVTTTGEPSTAIPPDHEASGATTQEPSAAPDHEASGATASQAAALPNQGLSMNPGPRGGDVDTGPEAESAPDAAEASTAPGRGQEVPDPQVQFVAGVDEAFDRARRDPGRASRPEEAAPTSTSARVLKTLDALLARWSPVVTVVGGRAPTLSFLARTGVSAARAIDAAIQSLAHDATRGDTPREPRPDPDPCPTSAERTAIPVPVAAASLGLSAVALSLADLIRRHAPSVADRSDRDSGGEDQQGRDPFRVV